MDNTINVNKQDEINQSCFSDKISDKISVKPMDNTINVNKQDEMNQTGSTHRERHSQHTSVIQSCFSDKNSE